MKQQIAMLTLLAVLSNCLATNNSSSRQSGVRRTTAPIPPESCGDCPQSVGWPTTEGSSGGGRHSPLTDINRDNVSSLEIAWTYRHGDYRSGGMLPDKYFKATAFESTPIVVEERLIFTTPYNRVIALNPETGVELWTFDPRIDRVKRNKKLARTRLTPPRFNPYSMHAGPGFDS